jgi:hypothetical protein
MTLLPYLLFWGFVIGNIFLLFGNFLPSELRYLIISFYIAGYGAFIGFLFTVKWLTRLMMTKISVVCLEFAMILGVILIFFFPYVWIVDMLNGIFGVLHLLMFVGGILSFKKQNTIEKTQS